MNENLDLTEILKDCPEGTKFYSKFLGSVEFCEITLDNYIEVTSEYKHYIEFKPNGTYKYSKENAEIDLFPSKEQRDWSKWHRPFVDGDIVYYDKFVSIFKKWGDSTLFYSHISIEVNSGETKDRCFGKFIRKESRFATEEEKTKLFQVIKDNGYKWNAETKILEKIKKEKFNPQTLQPFDKVLVSCNDEWFCDFFSHYDDAVNKFNCTCTGGCPYDYCIPYNDDTKHLIGKLIEDAPEFYRHWEE